MLLLQLPHLTCHSSVATLRGQLALVLQASATRLKLCKGKVFSILWVYLVCVHSV